MKNTSVFDGFCCQNLSWSQDGPQEPPKSLQALIFEAFLVNFGPFLLSPSTFLVDFLYSCLHLLWVEGATENNKQHVVNCMMAVMIVLFKTELNENI